MAFICPSCRKATLEIVASLEMGPDDSSDEIQIQAIRCSRCDLTGVAVYEESRRGSDDAWHHFGYPISSDAYDELAARLLSCSTPHESDCDCAAHAFYRVTKDGYWRGVDRLPIDRNQMFDLELAK